MARMIGRHAPDGPGGQAPGRDRKTARRRVKRSERQQWKREAGQ
ncbi:hypothetical protein ACWGKO_16455 [Streptomyces griseoincarnatus]